VRGDFVTLICSFLVCAVKGLEALMQWHRRTRMRPPFVKGQTMPMSGFFFFSAYRAWRRRPSVSCADVIAVHRCQPSVAAPHPY
jgi:hypothetical protein